MWLRVLKPRESIDILASSSIGIRFEPKRTKGTCRRLHLMWLKVLFEAKRERELVFSIKTGDHIVPAAAAE